MIDKIKLFFMVSDLRLSEFLFDFIITLILGGVIVYVW